KCLNEDDEVIECVSGIKIDVDSVKVVQEFYVKHELASDIILESKIDETVKDKNYVMKENNAPLDVVVKINTLIEGLGEAADSKANHHENEKGCNDLGSGYKNEEVLG
ncbi:13727_t:CDS:2, partial [Racocetra persica]